MHGLMMDYPLVLPRILERATLVFPHKGIVSRRADASLARSTYGELGVRVLKLMRALHDLGVRRGDRVATLAWNHTQHLELYFAVPCLGAVLHTVNMRLGDDQIRYLLQHAEDKVVFTDVMFAPKLAALRADLPTVQHFVVIDDAGQGAASPLQPCLDYEALVSAAPEAKGFPELDEHEPAGLCYTSGTTGEPKGVLYTHRSTFLHAMCAAMADSLGIGEGDSLLPVVPMFHVNAWGCPYACTLTGARQIMPNVHLQGRPLVELMASEKVTIAAGVPTVWALVLQFLKKEPQWDLSSLHTVVVGGSAAPRSMLAAFDALGIRVIHAWGMTETSPVGTVARVNSAVAALPVAEQMRYRLKQGVPVPGVEVKAVDPRGADVPRDGVSAGEMCVRGPWIAAGYYRNEAATRAAITADGWFKTGDIVTVDPHGYVEIVDRVKDVIKTRGEWVSSVAMENAAVGIAGVSEAAVVGRTDALRGEAPVLFVVRDPAHEPPVAAQAILDGLGQSFENWQVPKPADVHFVAAIPKTGVGKIDKKVLRARLTEA